METNEKKWAYTMLNNGIRTRNFYIADVHIITVASIPTEPPRLYIILR